MEQLALEKKTALELQGMSKNNFAGSPEGIDLVAGWLLKYGLAQSDDSH
jgi:hypothetical protein